MAGAAAMAPVAQGWYKMEHLPPRGFDLGQGRVRSLQNRLMGRYESMSLNTNEYMGLQGRLQFRDSEVLKRDRDAALECLRASRDEAVNLILEIINVGGLPVPPPEDLDEQVHCLLEVPTLHQIATLAEFVAHEWQSPRVPMLKFQQWQATCLAELRARERQAAQVIALKARVAQLKAQTMVLPNTIVPVRRINIPGQLSEKIVLSPVREVTEGCSAPSSKSVITDSISKSDFSTGAQDEDAAIAAVIDTAELNLEQHLSKRGGNGRRNYGHGPLEGETPPPGYICCSCGVRGHFIQHCPQERKTPPPGYVCYRCRIPGHFIHNCPTIGDPKFDNNKMSGPLAPVVTVSPANGVLEALVPAAPVSAVDDLPAEHQWKKPDSTKNVHKPNNVDCGYNVPYGLNSFNGMPLEALAMQAYPAGYQRPHETQPMHYQGSGAETRPKHYLGNESETQPNCYRGSIAVTTRPRQAERPKDSSLHSQSSERNRQLGSSQGSESRNRTRSSSERRDHMRSDRASDDYYENHSSRKRMRDPSPVYSYKQSSRRSRRSSRSPAQ